MSTSNRRRGQQPPQHTGAHTDTVRPFRFKHKGQTYTIPPAREGLRRMTAGDLIDVTESDDPTAHFKFNLATLRAAGVSDEAMSALRDMDIERFGRVLREWSEKTGGGPGKSGASSD